ncbi:uncharacterized protein LOC143207089 isoform X2 [Lasioglossum baleicum]|uniref:uncharacterized protein LOC143207089 isoform X2 n=1 Tax=Lasioglossum baleicum TaxID=434251 RepID=UPI003FCC29E2
MPTCVVKNCVNRTFKKNCTQEMKEKITKITFHRLPKNGISRQLWLKSLGLNESTLPKECVVCSDHFRSEDFDRTSMACTRLRPNAIPNIQVLEDTRKTTKDEFMESSNEASSFPALYSALKEEPSNSDVFVASSPAQKRSINVFSDVPLEKIQRVVSPSKNEYLQTLLKTKDESVQVKMSSIDKFTCISPERIFHSPTKTELRKQIARMQRVHQNEVKLLKQQQKRCIKKIENLKTKLQDLEKKNLLQGEHVEALEGLG